MLQTWEKRQLCGLEVPHWLAAERQISESRGSFKAVNMTTAACQFTVISV